MDAALDWLAGLGVARGTRVGVALHPERGIGLAVEGNERAFPTDDPLATLAVVEARLGPRWVWWDRSTADHVAERGIAVVRCWDVLTVQRLIAGRYRTSIARSWAELRGLPTDSLPTMGQLDLLDQTGDDGGDPDDPVRPDGHLRPEWIAGGWAAPSSRLARWAAIARSAAGIQWSTLDERGGDRAISTAHGESAAELLCAELSFEGLPVDVVRAEEIIAAAIGPRPTSESDADARRRARDDEVLRHLEPGPSVDLRNPADVKAMLRRVAVDVPDTRAWRLEQHRDRHPVVAALLHWRKGERIATTYGYRWLDEHVHGGRLRGEWTSSDGAAGRMTASAGLHNLPGELRPAVAAEPGHVFVHADLGQIEPRVLAAVSGDPALIAATADDDMYHPVAVRLGVGRDIAKVAVLGAMYGATTGESAHALRRLEREYPAAMGFLERLADAGRAGTDIHTFGGRRVRMWVDDRVEGDIDRARRVAAARGRFARNAAIQGAAAELFKVWAVIVRARIAPMGARIVLCLHDELLVHAPAARAAAAVDAVRDALAEAAFRWSPQPDVRFVADVRPVARWSDAKGG